MRLEPQDYYEQGYCDALFQLSDWSSGTGMIGDRTLDAVRQEFLQQRRAQVRTQATMKDLAGNVVPLSPIVVPGTAPIAGTK